MLYATLSLVALIIAIILGSIGKNINSGLVALTGALLIGVFGTNMAIKTIMVGFPVELFLMLVSVCIFFNIAETNGTLAKVTSWLVNLIHGNPALFPILFFLLSFTLAALGPGNIAATALVAPLGMAIAYKTSINPLLMAIMICTGANAGAFSPLAPTGIIGMGLMDKIGIDSARTSIVVFGASAGIQSLSAIGAYLLFGGYKVRTKSNVTMEVDQKSTKWSITNYVTLSAIGILVLGVLLFKLPIAMVALGLITLLSVFGMANQDESIKKVPWDIVLLVCGISVLIGVMDKVGGLSLATNLISSVSRVSIINATLALITGIVSAYSSSSGVVMPAFIPLIPGLIQKLGGGDPILMTIAIAVGSHMVDVSPLSTLGALTIAAANKDVDRNKLFRNLLLWGIFMAVVGSFLAWIFLDLRLI